MMMLKKEPANIATIIVGGMSEDEPKDDYEGAKDECCEAMLKAFRVGDGQALKAHLSHFIDMVVSDSEESPEMGY